MARVADTSMLTALEQSGMDVIDILVVPPDDPTFAKTIPVSEFLVGLHRARVGRAQLLRQPFIDIVRERTTMLPFGLEWARVRAELTVHVMSRGQSLGINDILIGAIARTHGHSVLTINPKHVECIPVLMVERPVWS